MAEVDGEYPDQPAAYENEYAVQKKTENSLAQGYATEWK
jgi:hypothetical protein